MPAIRTKSSTPSPAADGKCRLCRCKLNVDEGDDLDLHVCRSCKGRPEARRLGLGVVSGRTRPGAKSAREFTAAERDLIRKLHGFMLPPLLLNLLNERLRADLGPDALPYTMDQLYAEIGDAPTPAAGGGHDWPGLRKLLAAAERAGTLAAVNEQVIDDFAVVFSLNQKQVLVLKDILLQTQDD